MKLKRLTALLACMGITLTGCSFSAGIETLLQPPKLTEQQEQIYDALINSGLSNINLKYPKSGSYLSAFIVANLDSEGSDEAIVFYEKTGLTTNDVSLRINVLDMHEGKWKSEHELPASGDEIEKVMISPLGGSDRVNIIVGSSSQGTNNIDIYRYENNLLDKFDTISSYAISNIYDINKDGQNELFIITAPTASSPSVAYCKWLNSENMLCQTSELQMNISNTDYSQMLYGEINSNDIAIYVDSIMSTNIHTEILTPRIDELGNFQLVNALENIPTDAEKTLRPSEYTSKDIDNDGAIEIPVPAVFPGYAENPEGEQLQMVNWLAFEPNATSNFTVKYQSYYNITDGYSFMMPSEWNGQVTAKLDTVSNELVFYKYIGEPASLSAPIPNNYFFVNSGAVGHDMTEIMRICVTENALAAEKINAGYDLIKPIGEKSYLVKIPKNLSETLVPTLSEIALFHFMFI